MGLRVYNKQKFISWSFFIIFDTIVNIILNKKEENSIIINFLNEIEGTEAPIKEKETEQVKNIIDETKINVNIKQNLRLGKKSSDKNKCRLMLVTLNDREQILPILKASET